MEFFDLINERYAVRAYKPDPVEEDKLNKVLDAARMAPTAANCQPFRIIVIHTRGKEKDLSRIYRREWFSQPPIVICIVTVRQEGWTRGFDGKSYVDVDAAIAMDHLTLAAANLGLGTCWIAAFDPAAAREILMLPEGVEPLLFTPLGYPADTPRPKERKPLSDLVRYEHW